MKYLLILLTAIFGSFSIAGVLDNTSDSEIYFRILQKNNTLQQCLDAVPDTLTEDVFSKHTELADRVIANVSEKSVNLYIDILVQRWGIANCEELGDRIPEAVTGTYNFSNEPVFCAFLDKKRSVGSDYLTKKKVQECTKNSRSKYVCKQKTLVTTTFTNRIQCDKDLPRCTGVDQSGRLVALKLPPPPKIGYSGIVSAACSALKIRRNAQGDNIVRNVGTVLVTGDGDEYPFKCDYEMEGTYIKYTVVRNSVPSRTPSSTDLANMKARDQAFATMNLPSIVSILL